MGSIWIQLNRLPNDFLSIADFLSVEVGEKRKVTVHFQYIGGPESVATKRDRRRSFQPQKDRQ